MDGKRFPPFDPDFFGKALFNIPSPFFPMTIEYTKEQEARDLAALQSFYKRQQEKAMKEAMQVADEIEKKILSPPEEEVEWDVKEPEPPKKVDRPAFSVAEFINRKTMMKISIPGGEELDVEGIRLSDGDYS